MSGGGERADGGTPAAGPGDDLTEPARRGGGGEAGGSDAVAPPPFDAAAALAQLQRACRDLRLTARGDAFERRGRRLVELALDDGAVAARLARRPAVTPEWDRRRLRSTAEQRQWLDTLKKKLAEWDRDE